MLIATAFLSLTFLVSLATFVIYPRAFIWASERRGVYGPEQGIENKRAHRVHSISLFISARNEEAVIRQKIENCLQLDYPREKLNIVVLSDGSTDGTKDIAISYAGRGIRLLHRDRWCGKNALLAEALADCRSELVVFSDANALYDPLAIGAINASMQDKSVGCVTGRLMLDDESTTNALESAMYWKGETRIKEAEGRLGCVVAANGAIFACRRALIPPLANDTANDFQIPLDVLAKGARSTFASDAIAREPVTANMKEEFARKRRIIIRGLTCICRAIAHLPLMIALHLVMRKVARWACPPLMLTCVIIACMALCIASEWRLLAILCAVLVTVLALAVAGRIGHGGKPTALVNYGVMLTCATTSALVAFLTGTRVESWVSPTSDRLPKE